MHGPGGLDTAPSQTRHNRGSRRHPMRTIPARRSAGKRDSAHGTKGLVVRHPVHNNIPDCDGSEPHPVTLSRGRPLRVTFSISGYSSRSTRDHVTGDGRPDSGTGITRRPAGVAPHHLQVILLAPIRSYEPRPVTERALLDDSP